METSFTVITPAWRIAHFVPAGIAALRAQTRSDVNFIIIDDGSDDDGATISSLRRHTAGDPRFTIVQTPNQGPGPARNVGIEMASGRYILFFDIDDYVAPDWIDNIDRLIKANDDPDILIFSYNEVNPSLKTTTPLRFPDLNLGKKQIADHFVDSIMGTKVPNGFVWNKAYKTSFLKSTGCLLPTLPIQQDEYFNLSLYPKASSIALSSQLLYDYFVYEKGNNRSRFIPDRLEIYRQIANRFRRTLAELNISDTEASRYIASRQLNGLLTALGDNLLRYSRPMRSQLRETIESGIPQAIIREAAEASALPHSPIERTMVYAIKNRHATLFEAAWRLKNILSRIAAAIRH